MKTTERVSKAPMVESEMVPAGEVTGAALAETSDGRLLPVAFDEIVNQPDVAIVKTLKLGDPKNNGVPGYVGLLVGRGEDVETSLLVPDGNGGFKEQEGLLPTWSVHPVKLTNDNGKLVWTPLLRVTHVLITPHQINAALARIFAQAERTKSHGMFAARWNGKIAIKGGTRTLNDFDVVERYELKETVAEPANGATKAA